MQPNKTVFVVIICLFSTHLLLAQYKFVQEVHEQTEKHQYRTAIERIDSALKSGNESIDDSVRASLFYIKAYAFQNLISSEETAMDSAMSNYRLVVSIDIYPTNIGALNS